MITLSAGLQNSLLVLEHLRNDRTLQDIDITVGTFTNCRECGLTFKLSEKEAFTWCVYEHRNSDGIIINGKEGYISMSGDLPYAEGGKFDYLATFSYNQHMECADVLAKMIVEFYEENKYEQE